MAATALFSPGGKGYGGSYPRAKKGHRWDAQRLARNSQMVTSAFKGLDGTFGCHPNGDDFDIEALKSRERRDRVGSIRLCMTKARRRALP
jgi:hypothetical protein